MKITCLSDIHDNRINFNIGECDILIFAGDATCHREPIDQDYINFNTWFSGFNAKHKILIAGNHDVLYEKHKLIAKSFLSKDLIYLENDWVEIEGIKIAGSPYSLKWNNWAFNTDEETLAYYYSLLQEDIDILVTHGPPKGILSTYRGNNEVGSESLLNYVNNSKVRYHIFGHAHQCYGFEVVNDKAFINCAITDNQNIPINKPIRFDYKYV